MMATTADLVAALDTLIADADFDDCGADAEILAMSRVYTFADAGVLTSNDGLVVTLSDGSEFQVTVVRSR